MKSIDVKSLLIGILGIALVMVLMGVTHNNSKHQIACNSRDCVLLNTNTGVTKELKDMFASKNFYLKKDTDKEWILQNMKMLEISL